eukprot:11272336-Alexandrium_andersonii.AAC.1
MRETGRPERALRFITPPPPTEQLQLHAVFKPRLRLKPPANGRLLAECETARNGLRPGLSSEEVLSLIHI